MAEQLDPKEVEAIEEIAVSNMWEIAALVEVLERKGVLTREEVSFAVAELRKRHPDATTLERPSRGATRDR